MGGERRADAAAAYHPGMARLFVMLMIVLLPLRGWAGDLMSVDAAVSGLPQQAAGTVQVHCPMHAEAKADPSSQTPSGTHGCHACGLCIPMAEAGTGRLDIVAFTAHATPAMDEVMFISATPSPTVRPPIP